MQKLNNAKEQLDDACDLYCRKHFVSALTLAGAAEELLGGLVQGWDRAGGAKVKTALGERVAAVSRLKGTDPEDKKERDELIAFLNHPRNAMKHSRTHVGTSRVFKIAGEALDMIERAILNFRRATGDFPDSDAFDRFRGKSMQQSGEPPCPT